MPFENLYHDYNKSFNLFKKVYTNFIYYRRHIFFILKKISINIEIL